MKRIRKKNYGFTLVEIIISMALIGIIAVSFLSLFTAGFSTVYSMGRKTQTMNYDAQRYMDQIYDGTSPADIDLLDGVSVVVIDDYDGTGMRLITVTVDYPPDRSVTLKSLVP
ncbi:MAG: type II secretion system protein [Bacillota bacterium]|nr:type II secretion system protein [Bacillota bacterium]